MKPINPKLSKKREVNQQGKRGKEGKEKKGRGEKELQLL